jgi:hypothetical protein
MTHEVISGLKNVMRAGKEKETPCLRRRRIYATTSATVPEIANNSRRVAK